MLLVSAYPPGRDKAAEAAEKTMQAAVARSIELGAVDTTGCTVAGSPVSVLLAKAQETGADLLAVGNHHLSTVTGRLLGSVPAGIMRQATCDVFIAHTTGEHWRRLADRQHDPHPRSIHNRTIAVGIHATQRSRRAAEKAAELAADTQSQLVLVGASEPPNAEAIDSANKALGQERYLAYRSTSIEESLHEAESVARRWGVKRVRVASVQGDAMSALLDMIGKYRADVLVMGNHQLSGRARRLLETISSQVSRRVSGHVLLVH